MSRDHSRQRHSTAPIGVRQGDALIRDSKNASGGVLAFSVPAWSALVGWIGSHSPQV